jgi:hypothetical protein
MRKSDHTCMLVLVLTKTKQYTRCSRARYLQCLLDDSKAQLLPNTVLVPTTDTVAYPNLLE